MADAGGPSSADDGASQNTAEEPAHRLAAGQHGPPQWTFESITAAMAKGKPEAPPYKPRWRNLSWRAGAKDQNQEPQQQTESSEAKHLRVPN